MKILEERKVVTISATADEIDTINEIDMVIIGEYSSIIDLDTYIEFSDEVEIIEMIIAKLSENSIEANMLQFICID